MKKFGPGNRTHEGGYDDPEQTVDGFDCDIGLIDLAIVGHHLLVELEQLGEDDLLVVLHGYQLLFDSCHLDDGLG